MKIRAILVLFTLVLSLKTYSNVLGLRPGLIPRDQSQAPATDLLYDGKILLPHEVMELAQRGVDLSRIDPAPSDLWNREDQTDDNEGLDQLEVDSSDVVEYLTPVISRTGNFRFTALKSTSEGAKAFTFMVSKKIHNVLLRKALLRKLGYSIPAIKYVKKIKVRFGSKFEKENFVNRLAEDTFGDPKRWLIAESSDEKEIVLQDLIVMPSDNLMFNLAIGYMPNQVIKGRRVLNSLLVPYSLTYVPESVNLFPWNGGRLVSENIKLEYDSVEEFSTSFDDAKWILREIGKLTRYDFIDIVKAGHYPLEVEALIVEKLIARRNDLMKLFGLDMGVIGYNPNISSGEFLKKGKLLRENWEGYGSRFSFGDPDSPLSGSEIFAFFRSQFYSNIISNAVGLLNSKLLNVDVQAKVTEELQRRAAERFLKFLETGVIQRIPFDVFAIPTFGVNVIASRDIVAGTYLGADNVVQLADTVGLNVDVGAYLGTEGIPLPIVLSGRGNAHVTRRYSHLRPIKSMKKALKTSFKNMIVPWLKRKNGKILDELLQPGTFDLKDEQKQEKITEVIGKFKKSLEIGESFIITDSIGAGLSVTAGYSYMQLLRAQATMLGNQIVISRLHIHRKDQNTIQIYKDLGNMGRLGISFQFNAVIPIIKVSATTGRGSAKTKFLKLNIDDNLKRNPDVLRELQALRAVLVSNDIELATVVNEPFMVKHKVKESVKNLGLLWWRWTWQNTKDLITVSHPKGGERYFYRLMRGKRRGNDYQTFAVDSVNALISEYADFGVGLSAVSNGNPADTFMGKAKTREVTFEGELVNFDKKKGTGDVRKPFMRLTHRWKGWRISFKKLKKIMSGLKEKYGSHFFPEQAMHGTKSLQLYTVNLNLQFYHKGLAHLMSLSKRQARAIVRTVLGKDRVRVPYRASSRVDRFVRRLARFQKKYAKYSAKKDLEKMAKYSEKLVSMVEEKLPLAGIVGLVGGPENIFINAQVQGFRKGDENGDRAFLSNSIGQFGDRQFAGPLAAVQGRMDMSHAEFYILWMLGVL